MSNHGTPLIDGTYANFQAAVLKQLPRDIDSFIMNGWIDHQESLAKALREALVPPAEVIPSINWHVVYEKLGMLSEWEKFSESELYHVEFELKSDPQTTQGDQNSSQWPVPVLKGVTLNKAVKALRDLGVKFELFGQDLDRDVPTNDRDPKNGSYLIRFKKNVEADPENANQSANDRKAANAKDITLLERLLLELGYFLATGQHLDVQNATLCAGSRHSDGSVPYVFWGSGNRWVYVNWYYVDNRNSSLRSRVAVSKAALAA